LFAFSKERSALNSSGTACLTEDFEQENSEAAKTEK